jgi:hypothetical protein
MGEHLYALDQVERLSGARMGQVIFEPAFQPKRFAARCGWYSRESDYFRQLCRDALVNDGRGIDQQPGHEPRFMGQRILYPAAYTGDANGCLFRADHGP